MRKVILICNAGMSSSLMAKKVSESLEKEGIDIKVDATTSGNSENIFTSDTYEMILVSPQIRMLYDDYKKRADETGKKIAQIPFNAYAPTPMGVKNMQDIITENI
ncbi:PTS cellobiose transporter subunit IIB [Anaerococcus sp. AGMB09787]|uniref:PTS cellobiose transporter subunit IIB n=1 Tax=Anaerococcus sp. AGMB09787 TaxID=2922869 RepID=UPI001FAFC883|nr:PTS cellobiose transporter subunit IIB [Anaerococcus sp. AGMB09787]